MLVVVVGTAVKQFEKANKEFFELFQASIEPMKGKTVMEETRKKTNEKIPGQIPTNMSIVVAIIVFMVFRSGYSSKPAKDAISPDFSSPAMEQPAEDAILADFLPPEVEEAGEIASLSDEPTTLPANAIRDTAILDVEEGQVLTDEDIQILAVEEAQEAPMPVATVTKEQRGKFVLPAKPLEKELVFGIYWTDKFQPKTETNMHRAKGIVTITGDGSPPSSVIGLSYRYQLGETINMVPGDGRKVEATIPPETEAVVLKIVVKVRGRPASAPGDYTAFVVDSKTRVLVAQNFTTKEQKDDFISISLAIPSLRTLFQLKLVILERNTDQGIVIPLRVSNSTATATYDKAGISFQYPCNWRSFSRKTASGMRIQMTRGLREFNRSLVSLDMYISSDEESCFFVSTVQADKALSAEDILSERRKVHEDAMRAGDVTRVNTLETTTVNNLPAVI